MAQLMRALHAKCVSTQKSAYRLQRNLLDEAEINDAQYNNMIEHHGIFSITGFQIAYTPAPAPKMRRS